MNRVRPALLAIASLISLEGCALQPLYGGGRSGPVATSLGHVEVVEIEGKAGWLVRNALRDRLGVIDSAGASRYRLRVVLDDQITGFGVRRDSEVTRERRMLRARYQLTDTATGQTLLDATSGSDAGIDVVNSEYATIAAEDSALERLSETVADQIVARLAMFARSQSAAADPPSR